jgi:hypothetical protein
MGDTTGFVERSIDVMESNGMLYWNLPHLLAFGVLFVDEQRSCS